MRSGFNDEGDQPGVLAVFLVQQSSDHRPGHRDYVPISRSATNVVPVARERAARPLSRLTIHSGGANTREQ